MYIIIHAHINAQTTQTHNVATYIIKQATSYSLRIQMFHKILLQYTYVALFRDKTDGSLRGMTLIGVDKEVAEGKNCTVFKV